MANYLISTTDTYRVDNEAEAQALINAAKQNQYGNLTKYTDTYKEIKVKGEVVDAYQRVTLTYNFNNEKEPDNNVGIFYGYADGE